MAYETQPGTVPHRAVEWLKSQPEGFAATTAILGEVLDVECHSLSTWLAPARKAGLLRAETRKGEGRTLYWSLGDGKVQEQPEEEPTAAEVEPVDFHAAHWSDGDIDLYGLIELEDGGYRIKAENVPKLKRLIAWSPAP